MRNTATLEKLENLTDVIVHYSFGYESRMSDFHRHDYYEISIITSGNVLALTERVKAEGCGCKLLLHRPFSAHFVSLVSSELPYERINVNFTAELIGELLPNDTRLLSPFCEGGSITEISEEVASSFVETAKRIQGEANSFRRRLLLAYLLSQICDLPESKSAPVPSFVGDAMSYVAEHYREKIVAADVAWAVGVGRTTLMTAFRRHTGITFNDYLVGYRLNQALKLLKNGATQQEIAESCGFGDACSFARTFKSRYGLPPRRYAEFEK